MSIVIDPSKAIIGRNYPVDLVQPQNSGLSHASVIIQVRTLLLPYASDIASNIYVNIANSNISNAQILEGFGILPQGATALIQNLGNILSSSSTYDILITGIIQIQNQIFANPAFGNSPLSSIIAITINSAYFWNNVTISGSSPTLDKVKTKIASDVAGAINGFGNGAAVVHNYPLTNFCPIIIGGLLSASSGSVLADTQPQIVTQTDPTGGSQLQVWSFQGGGTSGGTHNSIIFQTLNDRLSLGVSPALAAVNTQLQGFVTTLQTANILPAGSTTIVATLGTNILGAASLSALTTAIQSSYTSHSAGKLDSLTSLLSIAYYGNILWQQVIDSGTSSPLTLATVQSRILWDMTGFARGLLLSAEEVYDFGQFNQCLTR